MFKKLLFLLVLCIFSGFYCYAQENGENEEVEAVNTKAAARKQDFWLALSGDAALYSSEGFAYGGGIAFGYGSGSSIGVKAVWFMSTDGVDTLELSFLLRFYLMGVSAYSGPYIQILGGPSLYNKSGEVSVPSTLGIVSAGLSFGWRFVFANRFFIEPAVRAGYPYLAGAAVSAGVRF